ncbi:MAG: hypothetical protein WCT99_00630 [Bacteroidota bacterium]|jgi:hypothetical protein
MVQLTQKDLERILSLYIDGELDPIETATLQEYLAAHPSVARDLEILQSAKKTISKKRQMPSNEWFWLKLSNTIESNKTKRKNIFFHSSAPSVVLISILVVAVIGGVYFKNTNLFRKFFEEKKNQVQNSLMTGNILPLFTNLTNDDVLNFALFGKLPLDSSKETELQVKNDENKRSQYEIVNAFNRPSAVNITVSDFCQSVGVEQVQKGIIDSILGTYKKRLQTAVLVSENKEIAIHEELAQMNKAVVSTIVSSLEPVQKIKFQKYLNRVHAPYTVIAFNAPAVEPKILFERIPGASRTNRYVIVSKDTIGIAEMKMNLDSIRDVVNNHAMYRRVATERMFKDLAEIQHGSEHSITVAGSNPNRVRLHATDNAFQINFESVPPVNNFDGVENIRPRIESSVSLTGEPQGIKVFGDSAFVMEMQADKEMIKVLKKLPSGEFRVEFIDSLRHSPRMKVLFKSAKKQITIGEKNRSVKPKQEKLIDIDSLLNESKKQELKSAEPSKNSKLFEM